MNNIQILNSISGKKEVFRPLLPNKVLMYVCGVTPYDHAHVGHGRCYVSFDTWYRFFKFLGYEIIYCRNFTDIDDKLLIKAQKELGDRLKYPEIAERFMKSFQEEMHALQCMTPDFEPRVTENIPQIITFIEGLIEKGFAYCINGDVYFRINAFPHYGKLSKQKIEELRAGVRVDVREQKEDPLDFALWKSEPEGEFWDSPWGYGRPGWHIECSVLAKTYLGDQIDIHGGGLDLIFPHHENEIAQSESFLGKEYATYWVHNGLVTMHKEKMSKSIGNVSFLCNLFEQFDPMVVRYYFLTHHYHAPFEFSIKGLEAAQKTYQRLCKVFAEHTAEKDAIATSPIARHIIDFLSDDLNTPGLLGVVFEHLGELKQNKKEASAVKYLLQDVLGLLLIPLPEQTVEVTPEIQTLLAQREQARAQKDWKRADELRDKLREMGVEIQDKKLK